MKTAKKNSIRRRATRQLIRMALRHWGSDRCWRAIAEMQMRGSADTLALARRFTTSSSWRRRCLGLYIASQLGQRRWQVESGSTEFSLAETQELLLAGLGDENEEVICAAASGLGHRPHPAALARLVALATHQNALLRQEVAIALGRYAEPGAVAALLQLASDADDRVRDWATFGLGSMQEANTPEIREILWKNLHDCDDEVRGEALTGLAERGDHRVLPYLIEHLDAGCRVYELNAAEKLGSPLLLDALQNIAHGLRKDDASDYWLKRLNAAITACGGVA